MTTLDAIDRWIGEWEQNEIAGYEFCDRVVGALWDAPPAIARLAIERLRAHPDEQVREAAHWFVSFKRNEALSADLGYVKDHSPLRPGVRLELFGGYDYYADGGKPSWLNGADCYRAVVLGFASYAENRSPALLVAFDEIIDVFGRKGRFGALFSNYGLDWVAWAPTEGVAEICVAETLPADAAAIAALRASRSAIETHATYRIEGTA